MNVVDKFVLKSMLNYPSIFSNRAAVLNHTLFVIGNGVEWGNNGKLVTSSDRPCKTVKQALARIEQQQLAQYAELDLTLDRLYDEEDQEGRKRYKKVLYGGMIDRCDEDRQTVINAETLAVIKCPVSDTDVGYYGNSFGGYGNIFNIPLDIHKDWLAACYEIAEWTKLHNPNYTKLIKMLDIITEAQAEGHPAI
jgi:hypothetical protein